MAYKQGKHAGGPRALCPPPPPQLADVDAKMLKAGSDLDALAKLSEKRSKLQASVDGYYAEWDELEALIAEVA